MEFSEYHCLTRAPIAMVLQNLLLIFLEILGMITLKTLSIIWSIIFSFLFLTNYFLLSQKEHFLR